MNFVSENYEMVTCIAKEIAAGKDSWQELMHELDDHKKMMCRKYHAYLSKFCTYEDIVAVYDDCVMDTIQEMRVSHTENYLVLLSVAVKARIINLWKHCTRKKRSTQIVINGDTVHIVPESLNAQISADEKSIALQIKDQTTENELRYIELVDQLTSQIQQFAKKGSREKEQAKLLLVELECALYDFSDGKERLLCVLPAGTKWDSCRQKLSRAKKSFREFCNSVTT